MIRQEPLISVIIPTFQRPSLVVRAVRSALVQTFRKIEVVVVVDGGDEATVSALGTIDDARLRVIIPSRRLGNADARNVGVEQSAGRWIAFLDDDDLWMPEKLLVQIATAEKSRYPFPIISCRMIGRNELGDSVWPRRYPRPDEPICEYLFCRTTPFTGEGMVQTSTILTSRGLLERVPFAGGMRRYVDLDWMLRAAATEGVGLEFVATAEPLSVWNMEAGRERISNGADGEYTLQWVRGHRDLFTRRAYGAFLLTIVSMNAAQAGEWRHFFPILREARQDGDPAFAEIVAHVAYFVLPDRLKRMAAAQFTRFAQFRQRRSGIVLQPSATSRPAAPIATPQ